MARRFPSVASLALKLLSLYRLTAAWRRPTCRFYPSCSKYAYQSIEMHGFCKGLGLTAMRLLRCHPFHQGGIDEVPAEFHATLHAQRPHAC